MAPGQMEVNGCVVQLGVSEQHLDGAQISAGLQHVRGHTLRDAGAFFSFGHGGSTCCYPRSYSTTLRSLLKVGDDRKVC